MPPRRVTLHDVARAANVSYQTVSRVIHEHPHVANDTRQRVLESIQQLGYRPNMAARSLVTRRSCTLGIVAFGKNYYGPAQMLANIERAARIQGYNLTFASIEAITRREIRSAIVSLGDHLVDGIILITPTVGLNNDDLSQLIDSVPCVQIDIELGSPLPSVVIDQGYGSELATQHLIDLGHREICEISGALDWFGAFARHQRWLHTLKRAGIRPGPSVEGDWTPASGYAAALRLIESGARFSGLVVGNDQMALGAMRALREHGRRVPEDVSIIGFDDIPEAAYFEPPLTTIRQDFAALGQQSVDYLIALINNPDTPREQRVLYPQLVCRQSARPA